MAAERTVFKGVLVATLPGHGPSHSPPNPFVEDAEVLVCKVGVLAGPVCASEIMGPGQGFVPVIQIPHGVGEFSSERGLHANINYGVNQNGGNDKRAGETLDPCSSYASPEALRSPNSPPLPRLGFHVLK